MNCLASDFTWQNVRGQFLEAEQLPQLSQEYSRHVLHHIHVMFHSPVLLPLPYLQLRVVYGDAAPFRDEEGIGVQEGFPGTTGFIIPAVKDMKGTLVLRGNVSQKIQSWKRKENKKVFKIMRLNK